MPPLRSSECYTMYIGVPAMKLPRFTIDDDTRRTIDETKDKALRAGDRALRVTDSLLQPKLVLPLFAAVLVLLALVSAVVMIREHRPKPQPTEPTALTQQTQTGAEARGTLQGNFLLVFADNAGRIKMLAVVQADSEAHSLAVSYVQPSERAEVNNLNGSMQQHYDKGGATELAWAVGAFMERTIDRYVIANDDRFINFCKMLGEHELTIETGVQAEYEGISFVIKPGKQKLTSDTLCKYFGYCCKTLYQGGDAKVSELLGYLVQKLLSPENEARFDRILAKLIGEATTNISAMDLQGYSAVRPAFSADGAPVALVNEGVFRPAQEAES